MAQVYTCIINISNLRHFVVNKSENTCIWCFSESMLFSPFGMVRCAEVSRDCPAIFDNETAPFVRDFLAISVDKHPQTAVLYCLLKSCEYTFLWVKRNL
jgi:hypothetical protein